MPAPVPTNGAHALSPQQPPGTTDHAHSRGYDPDAGTEGATDALSETARSEWERAEDDAAADAVNAGRFASVRGLYGEARQQWSSANVTCDPELAPVARQHLKAFAADPIAVGTAIVVIVVNVLLILRFVGASA